MTAPAPASRPGVSGSVAAGTAASGPTVAAALASAAARAGVDRIDAQVLLAHVLGRSRTWLFAHGDDALAPAPAAHFARLVARRAAGEPVAYLTGIREFHGRDFAVSPAVLIPRPDTELLVEHALDGLPPRARVLELATGSGIVAITLALARPDITVLATDVSTTALAIARANADRHRVPPGRLRFAAGDWYGALDTTGAPAPAGGPRPQLPTPFASPSGPPLDLIVANPPYIAADDPHLVQGDLRFEPPGALASGADGLDAIRAIVAGAPARLAAGGRLLLEHGHDQGRAVRALLAAAGLRDASTWRDLGDQDRVSGGVR